MADLWSDIREIDGRGWIAIAMVGLGNICLVVTGLLGSATIALLVLSALGFAWVILLQLTRVLMHSNLDFAKETIGVWQTEVDFSREVVEECVDTINDLKRYDLQSAGIHLERVRASLIKRNPELADEIVTVEHPLNVPGLSI